MSEDSSAKPSPLSSRSNKGKKMLLTYRRCEMEFPLVLIVANKIKDVKDITPILDLVKKTKRSFVLFSEDL